MFCFELSISIKERCVSVRTLSAAPAAAMPTRHGACVARTTGSNASGTLSTGLTCSPANVYACRDTSYYVGGVPRCVVHSVRLALEMNANVYSTLPVTDSRSVRTV